MKKMVFSYFNRYEQGPEARNSAKEVKVAEAKAEMADMQAKDIVAKARQLFDEAGGKLKTTDTKLVCYVQKVLEQNNYNTNVTTKLPMTNFVDGDRGRSSKFNLQEFYQLNTLDRTGTLTGEFFDKAESLATNQDPSIEAAPATPDSTTLIQSVITLGLDKPQTVFAGVEGAKDKREGMNTKMKLLNFTAYAQDPTVVALTERGILKQPTSGMLILNNIYNSVLTFDENQDYTNDNTNKYAIQIAEGKSDFSWFTINPFDFAATDDGSGVFKFNTDAIAKEFINQYKRKLQLEQDNISENAVAGHKEDITAIDKKLQTFNWKGKDLDKKISALNAIRQEYVAKKAEVKNDMSLYEQDKSQLETQLNLSIAKVEALTQTQYDRKTVITADNAYSGSISKLEQATANYLITTPAQVGGAEKLMQLKSNLISRGQKTQGELAADQSKYDKVNRGTQYDNQQARVTNILNRIV